jgi:hypothetical protein
MSTTIMVQTLFRTTCGAGMLGPRNVQKGAGSLALPLMDESVETMCTGSSCLPWAHPTSRGPSWRFSGFSRLPNTGKRQECEIRGLPWGRWVTGGQRLKLSGFDQVSTAPFQLLYSRWRWSCSLEGFGTWPRSRERRILDPCGRDPRQKNEKRPALQAGALALRERIGVKFLYCRYLATYFATRSSNPLAMPCSAQPGFNREPSTWKVLCPNEASSGI